MNILKILFINIFFTITLIANTTLDKKRIVYITPDMNIPFWQIMAKGVQSSAKSNNYNFSIYDSNNNAKKELQLTIKAIREKVDGIVVSPTNSSACVTILKLAKSANIPVVILDIGTDAGEYVSYISSNNKDGAYNAGKILTEKMIEKGWEKGKVGIIAIPQKRLNGQERTAGFMKALNETNIHGADIKQLNTWSKEETYIFVKEMIKEHKDLRAIWIQTSSIYKSALKAIYDENKQDNILLVAFDAEPEFLDLIPKGKILASGMQQPFLMGKEAALAMHKHISGYEVKKSIQVPILSVSTDNIRSQIDIIKLNVLGIEK